MTHQLSPRQQALTRRWRRASRGMWGRLYWRGGHPGWSWEAGEIARIVNHPVVTHFFSMAAVEEFIESEEQA